MKKIKIILSLLLLTTSLFSQLPRLRFTQIQQADTSGLVLASDNNYNISYSTQLRYIGSDLLFGGIKIPNLTDVKQLISDSIINKTNTDFSNVSGTLPIANGGTGSSTQNFVDLTSAQTIGGLKTFTSSAVFSSAAVAAQLLLRNNNDSEFINIGQSTGNQKQLLIGSTYASNVFYLQGIQQNVGFNQSITLNSLGGNVGIGTTNPTSKLHISTSDNDEVFIGTIGNDQIVGGRTNGSFSIKTKSGSNGNMFLIADNNLYFRTGGANDRVFISNTGNVGIGTTNPNYKLHLEGSGTANEIVAWFNNQGAFSSSLAVRQSDKTAYLTNHSGLGTPNYDGQLSNAISWGVSSGASPIQFWNGSGGVGGRGTAKMTILESGNVGIGTSTPSYKLDVYQGDVATTGHTYGDLRLSGNLSGYGTNTYPTLKTSGNHITFDANNTYTGYISYNTGFIDVSDGILKTFVEPIQNATDILMNLEGVRYSWADGRDDFETHAGFVAQQVLNHYPEAVNLSEVGIYGISSPPLIALAVTTIQEQQAIIEEQSNKIQILEAQIQLILQEIENLKNK